MRHLTVIITFLTLFCNVSFGQNKFSHQDTLRGTITPERAWWDLTYYHLSVAVNIKKKTISGSNLIQYKVLESKQALQLELQEPLKINRVVQNGKELEFTKDGYSYFVVLNQKQKVGSVNELTVFYEGTPQESKNPPWSGGLTWDKDKNGNDWVVTTCQGDGASLWWPNKDHAYDEPDSMLISIIVPKHLIDVSNGQLRSVVVNGELKTYNWFVSNPINNYGVNMNIGDYVHYGEIYKGLNGNLKCDYYVLRENLKKAKQQFKEAPRMLAAFEHWFGPYPFYKDGYKLIEVPYAGMEHQSSVTYGNGFKNGYKGRDISGTGWGMKFDFIIVHESGHEWFANNITHKDVADMWIHESFTSYSENLFLNYHFGKKASSEYVIGKRRTILNDRPIVGIYNVHYEGSEDMYNKGANMLHTLRQRVDNDEKWRAVLRGLNKYFYHQTVTSNQIENYLSKKIGVDLNAFFNQYLRTIKIPIFEYRLSHSGMEYRYKNVVEDFEMPIKIIVGDKPLWVLPKIEWQKLEMGQTIRFDQNFYVNYQEIKKE
ncbi:MAG: M1 family metallopeptidase [Flavobacteriales bacterium]|tara:strand:- start:291 stop:1916 length:1626 start_codon:yes stop_codon:yes gene_type:complete